jgi:hypothetical protein
VSLRVDGAAAITKSVAMAAVMVDTAAAIGFGAPKAVTDTANPSEEIRGNRLMPFARLREGFRGRRLARLAGHMGAFASPLDASRGGRERDIASLGQSHCAMAH